MAWVWMAERLLGSVDGEGFANALVAGLGEFVAADRGLLVSVQRGAPPRVLSEQAPLQPVPCGEIHGVGTGGRLVVDPYCRAFLEGAPAGFYADGNQPGNAAGGVSHVAFVAPVSGDACLVLVLLRASGGPVFSPPELERYRGVERAVCSALSLHWRSHAAPRGVVPTQISGAAGLQERVEAALDRFGSQVLTCRECEVIRLLLRGHSSKAAAECLGIATATAALHRKRAYAKLGVRSQAQLFYHFICSLSAGRGAGVQRLVDQESWPRAASVGP